MPADEFNESEVLLRRAAEGDRESWGALLEKHRDRLLRMISLRLDVRLHGRLDASDVMQEACLDASARLQEYLAHPNVPFYLWLRGLTGQRLISLHRRHLGAQRRSAGREVSLDHGNAPATTAAGLAACLIGHEPRPSEAMAQAERQTRYQTALESLEPLDREVLALRHYEQLSNSEVAQVLDLKESAASKRYIRAVQRLKDALENLPGGLSEARP